MTALATILAMPIVFVRWLLTHPKALVALAFVFVAVLMLRNCAGETPPALVGNSEFLKVAPSIKEAPYILHTSSRAYYVVEYQKADGYVLLVEYYTYDKKRWDRKTFPLKISEQYYGEVLLSER